MKNLVSTLFIVCGITFSLAQEKLNVDISKSEIKWYGEYAFYFGGHDGIIDLKQGYFIKTDGKITGGTFVLDMTSIQSVDMDNAQSRLDLDKHLKNEDFFEVNNFPTTKLDFTRVSYESETRLKIYANLTIKSITKPINFVAEVNYDKKEMATKFKIDRTLWGITFNSKEVEGKLKDGLISDAVGFEVTLSL